MIIKNTFIATLILIGASAWSACPNLSLNEINNSPDVKKANISSETIYFCKDISEHIQAEHYILDVKEKDFIGNIDGTKVINLGSYSANNIPIGTSSVTIQRAATTLENPLKEISQKVPIIGVPPWSEPSLFHFYRANKGTACSSKAFYAKFRDTLRTNAGIFQAGRPGGWTGASSYSSEDWELGIIEDAELKNNGNILKADIIFFWEQYQRSGNAFGGAVASRKYCHLAVAVEIKIKADTAGFNLQSPGNYTISVGVATK